MVDGELRTPAGIYYLVELVVVGISVDVVLVCSLVPRTPHKERGRPGTEK